MIDSIEIDAAAGGASLLALVGDPIRYQVLNLLARDQRCVCDLQELIPVPMNLLSYHLRELREAGLVECTKRGRRRDYRLAPGALARLRQALPGTGSEITAATADGVPTAAGEGEGRSKRGVRHGSSSSRS